MKTLWKISIATTLDAEDAVAELLGVIFGRPAASHFNVETRVSVVSVYGPQKIILSRTAREEIVAGLKRIKDCGLKTGAGRIKIARVRREDWAESWKRHFKPIEIGSTLLVKPSWIKRKPRKNQAVMILDPGLSFGTGQHPTTAFCLHEIVRQRKIGTHQAFLDIGTGSGILAIAAAKLGYKPVRAIDFDPEAVRVASANTRMNGVHKKLRIARGDVAKLPTKPKEQFDLICANMISNLLIAERKRIVAQLNRGGTLVLAGILKPEFPEVRKKFESLGLQSVAVRSKKEWSSGSFCFTYKKKF